MNPDLVMFLAELSDLIEKHKASLFYTNADDGVHVKIGPQKSISIGWPENGNVSEIRKIIVKNSR